MARKIRIVINTASNYVSVEDCDTVTTTIYKMLNCGFGEFTMEQSGNSDLSESSARITLVHDSGVRFGQCAFTDFQSINVNGSAATITDLETVRAVLAPYFFSVGNGGFAFTTIVELTPTLLTTAFSTGGIQLLPALGAHLYPKFEMDFVNLGDGSEAFGGGNVFEVKVGTQITCRLDATLCTIAGPTEVAFLQVRPNQLQGVNGRFQYLTPNTALMLNTIGNANFTISNVANGSRVFVVVRYNIFNSQVY